MHFYAKACLLILLITKFNFVFAQCAITGTAVSGAGAVTIAAEEKYVAKDAVLSGNVTMSNAAAVFRVNDICGGSSQGSWTGKLVSDPTAGSTINIYGSVNSSAAWGSFTGGGATITIYSSGSMTIPGFSGNGGNYTINNHGTFTVNGNFNFTGTAITINNWGTVTITGTAFGAATTATIDNKSGATMNIGTLNFNSGGTLTNSGNLNVTNGITFTGGTWTNNGFITCASFNNSVACTNNKRIDVTGNFNNTSSNFNMGNGAYINSGSWSNTGGTIIGPAAGCAAFNVSGNTTNTGTISAANSSRIDVCDRGLPPSPFVDVNSGTLNSMTHCSCVVLPVSLLSFTAETKEAKVYLKWTTATETNNDYFTIERSGNSSHFEPIVQMRGAGTCSRPLNYFYYDEYPLIGINYYRLKQTDYDGKYTYSPIAAVDKQENEIGLIFPNPTTGPFTIELNKGDQNKFLLVMQDIYGREIYHSEAGIITPSGSNLLTIIPDENIASGIYYVIASSDDKIVKRRLIITK